MESWQVHDLSKMSSSKVAECGQPSPLRRNLLKDLVSAQNLLSIDFRPPGARSEQCSAEPRGRAQLSFLSQRPCGRAQVQSGQASKKRRAAEIRTRSETSRSCRTVLDWFLRYDRQRGPVKTPLWPGKSISRDHSEIVLMRLSIAPGCLKHLAGTWTSTAFRTSRNLDRPPSSLALEGELSSSHSREKQTHSVFFRARELRGAEIISCTLHLRAHEELRTHA